MKARRGPERWRREEGEMRDEGEERGGNMGRRRGKMGRLVMEEKRGGDRRWGREEAEIREYGKRMRKSELKES